MDKESTKVSNVKKKGQSEKRTAL